MSHHLYRHNHFAPSSIRHALPEYCDKTYSAHLHAGAERDTFTETRGETAQGDSYDILYEDKFEPYLVLDTL